MLGTAVAVTHLGLGPPLMGHRVDFLVKVVALSLGGLSSSDVVENSVVSTRSWTEHVVFARILAYIQRLIVSEPSSRKAEYSKRKRDSFCNLTLLVKLVELKLIPWSWTGLLDGMRAKKTTAAAAAGEQWCVCSWTVFFFSESVPALCFWQGRGEF